MKRLVVLLIVGFASLSAFGAAPAPKAPAATTVYITNTGKCYHRETCKSLAKSKIPISLEAAKAKGYAACKICKP